MQSWLLILIAFIIFWGILYIIGKSFKSKKINIYPLVLIARTGISMEPIKDKKKAKVISIFGYISLAISIGLMAYFYYIVGSTFVAKYIAQSSSQVAGFVPLIPGVTISIDQLIYFLIAIGIAVIVHELFHAIIARAEGIPVKDAGFFLLAFIPAAFVEPDDNKMKQAPLKSRLKVYSAGVTINLIMGLIFLLLFVYIAPKLFAGVDLVNILPNSPAYLANLKQGMTILSVNGTSTLSLQSFMNVLNKYGAESNNTAVNLLLTVKYNGVIQNISVFKPYGVPHLGISVVQSFRLSWLVSIISALYIINLGLALVNAAPIAIPLPGGMIQSDGGYIFIEAISKIGKKWAQAGITIEIITVLLILSLLTIYPIRLP
ncbi:putative membrane-associated Zn-dependent protease [Caldisphaera lagunensis DSM 15908]|uniref:Putative membrane-associated Zn-dependent protease n=1 Tax=Caldisphaera lagunensis (strain DSM 15908 / JCM 11604 / ANMR 0165 / IC-154) TaxID=1056495 RepID=L0A9B4_CALLD|nr:site-2 protease family protein [Caldisphaera lagunensis]AFZ70014.1 putative membrane-associated Zn-dependent protease [Caldisphaera lagunensis DSM 15908]